MGLSLQETLEEYPPLPQTTVTQSPGANNLTGPGANNLTDQACADGNLPDVTTGLCADGSQPQAFNATASPPLLLFFLNRN